MPTHEDATDDERRAWDLYAALKPDPGTESRDAAAHADEMLAERRKRFGGPRPPAPPMPVPGPGRSHG